MVQTFDTGEDEISAVSSWISARVADGVSPGEIGVFVRSENEFDRAETAIVQSGNQWAKLTEVTYLPMSEWSDADWGTCFV